MTPPSLLASCAGRLRQDPGFCSLGSCPASRPRECYGRELGQKARRWRPHRSTTTREEAGMSASGATPSSNGHGPDSWACSWTHMSLDRRCRGYCRVTFHRPPINTITATTVSELAELVGLIEQDPDLKVVVFASANSDFYLAHYDTANDPGQTAAPPPGPTVMHAWLDLLVRLARAPVVSTAPIRGRARGAGSEFALAC